LHSAKPLQQVITTPQAIQDVVYLGVTMICSDHLFSALVVASGGILIEAWIIAFVIPEHLLR
jgi:hypothetical protein